MARPWVDDLSTECTTAVAKAYPYAYQRSKGTPDRPPGKPQSEEAGWMWEDCMSSEGFYCYPYHDDPPSFCGDHENPFYSRCPGTFCPEKRHFIHDDDLPKSVKAAWWVEEDEAAEVHVESTTRAGFYADFAAAGDAIFGAGRWRYEPHRPVPGISISPDPAIEDRWGGIALLRRDSS